MTKHMFFTVCFLSIFTFTVQSVVAGLLPNPGFEDGADVPTDWPAANPAKGITYETEDGNRFARIHSDGGTAMLYREIAIPEGTEALRLAWRWRVTGLQKGTKSWFDARIMMEFMDANRGKVGGAPGAPNRGKDTDGWEERKLSFLVPENARILKFMPSLLNVAGGTLDLDDVSLELTDPAPLREAAEKKRVEAAAKQAAALAKRRDKAAKTLADTGSLLPGDRSVRLEQTTPGKLVNQYRVADIPADTEALRLTWRERVSDLKTGEKPMDFIPRAAQEDPNTFCPDLLGFVQQYRIHWTGFSMSPNATPRLLADWDYTPSPFWGAYAKRALGGERFEMTRMR